MLPGITKNGSEKFVIETFTIVDSIDVWESRIPSDSIIVEATLKIVVSLKVKFKDLIILPGTGAI